MTPIDFGTTGACLRRDALRAVGPYGVRSALRAGEAQAPWPRVLVDATRAGDPLTLVAAAQLAVGRNALVTGPSAAFLHGLSALPATPVHLIVPYEHRQRDRPGVVIHTGTGLSDDRDERQGVPVLRLDRVVSDLACTAHPPLALAVIDEALATLPEVDRPAFRRRLRERLDDRPDPRGTRIGRRLVDLATGRAASPPESWLMWCVVDLGFPVPEANLPVMGISGEPLYYVDLGWRQLRIALEYNGYSAHAGREVLDAARIEDLERRGWIVVIVELDDLRSTVRLEKELLEAFLRRGVDLRARTTGLLRPLPHRAPQAW
jgi:hypothetical protein